MSPSSGSSSLFLMLISERLKSKEPEELFSKFISLSLIKLGFLSKSDIDINDLQS